MYFPPQSRTASRAIEWVTRNIAAHGGDPHDLFIGGHSSGGHYAALLAVDDSWMTDIGPPREIIRGCLPISGVFEFGAGSGLSIRPRFLGPDPGSDARASPRLLLREVPPPFLIAYGTRDFPHLITQGARFATALREIGADVEELPLSERTHFSASYAGGEAEGPWVPKALAFMARHRR